MSARVFRDEYTDEVVVLVHSGGCYLYMEGGELRIKDEKRLGGERPPEFLRMKTRQWEEIVRAYMQVQPFDSDARSALADARGTRDRLLTLVEQMVDTRGS